MNLQTTSTGDPKSAPRVRKMNGSPAEYPVHLTYRGPVIDEFHPPRAPVRGG